VRSRKIFTYQHSEEVPKLIDEMSEERPRSPWRRWRPKPAYLLDRMIDGCLSFASIVLQEIKRTWIAITYLRIHGRAG
jgi:hypothetical protein